MQSFVFAFVDKKYPQVVPINVCLELCFIDEAMKCICAVYE